MDFTIHFDRAEGDPKSGPVTVGWLRTTNKGGIVFDGPERLVSREQSRTHAKSASRCPAVIGMESRFFVIKCPFDLHIGFARDKDGKAVLVNRAGASSAIRSKTLNEFVSLTNEVEWRYPDRPTIQLKLPYLFIADELVYLTQLGPFAHYRKKPLPGTTFGGRFPINIWPRPLMWAFEWHEPGEDVILKRGEPLFYCQFEGEGPDRPVQVIEAEWTSELREYTDMISGAVNYVNQTFSLFKQAEAIRPETLLSPKRRR